MVFFFGGRGIGEYNHFVKAQTLLATVSHVNRVRHAIWQLLRVVIISNAQRNSWRVSKLEISLVI